MDAQAQRTEIEARLRATIRLALLDPNDNWADPVLQVAAAAIRSTYRDLFHETLPTKDRLAILEKVRALLEGSDRDAQSDTAQANLLAAGAANYITSALLRAGTGPGWVKEWVTVGDDKVRESHRLAAEQGPVPAGASFDVGGHDMFAPGDVTAPIEEWANCRCHPVYRREDEDVPALVAAMAARTDEGFLTLSRELFDEALSTGIITESGIREEDGVVLYSLKDGTAVVAATQDQGEPMAAQPEEPLDLNGDYLWEEVPLYGVIAPENVPTGDKRKFLVDSLEWVEPPLSLSWQKVDQPGHDGASVTGRIDRIWKDAGLWKWEGGASMNTEADEMLALIAEKALRGISVDLDDTEVEFQTADGEIVKDGDIVTEEPTMAVSKGRIRKATAVSVPAFIEAFIAIGTWADHDRENEKPFDPVEVTDEAIAAAATDISAFAPGTQDGPGWLTHPVDTDRLRDYWVRGEGAAKIGWGAPGDFNRCRTLLAPYVKAQHLSGYCANRHKDALGIWPGEHRGGALAASAAQAQAEHPELIAPAWTIIPREEPTEALVASANPILLRPPGWWFERPPEFANIDKAQPVVVTEEGRFYGYAAEWGVCHLGYANECVYAPRSPSNYAWFRLGDKITTDGNVPIGVVTIGTGHAPLSMDAFHAAAHYDNTGTVAAQIASGDDEFGIWVAGCVAPSATPEQIDDLRASKLSGDWREIGRTRELDMVRVLAVNTPGFGIPRMALAASANGEEYRTALVAAGVIESSDERINRLVRDAVEETLAGRDRASAMQSIRANVYARRRAQIAALAARGKD